MMKWIFSGLILAAVVFGLLTGRMDAVTDAALRECGNAVELTLALMGSMVLWSGMMKIGQRAGLTEKIAGLFALPIRFLFRGMDPRGPAAQAISLNLSANLLGLGNAATPLGIAAMRELEKLSGESKTASDHMILFVVLNTTSLQLVPTTTALIRANAGARVPLDIMPAVWLASLCSVAVGVAAAKLLSRRGTGGGSPP